MSFKRTYLRRGMATVALTLTIVACQPPVADADEAQPALQPAAQPAFQPAVQQGAAPEYLNPNARAPYSEGVRHGGLLFLAGKL